MANLYRQVNSDKFGRAFIITLLLFILMAIVYAIIVYQSGKVYRTDIVSKKDTVYITNYAPAVDSPASVQQAHYAVSTTTSDNQAGSNANISFTGQKSAAINEALILKKIYSVQKQNNITNKFITLGEYPGISEHSTISQLTSLLQSKGYTVLSELEVITDVPYGVSVGRTAISENEYGVIVYVGTR